MTEFIDIFDKNGNPTDEVLEKNEAERLGKLHRTAHIWIINQNGELLLQLRAANKKLSPDTWGVSAGGHVQHGETTIQAAIRELNEEIGIKISAEKFVKIFTTLSNNNPHINDVFLVRLDLPTSAFKFNDNEAVAVKYVQ